MKKPVKNPLKSAMKIDIFIVSIAASLFPVSAAQAATTVNFVDPEKFADMPFTVHEKEHVKEALTAHFSKLGEKLPQGQDMKVDITDIDLAGEREPSAHRPINFRVLRGRADWPRINLRYTIESQGKVIKSGEDKISDMTYLAGFNRYSSNDYLRYEKKMLDDWFRKSVLQPAQ
jgi:hypothetical protein